MLKKIIVVGVVVLVVLMIIGIIMLSYSLFDKFLSLDELVKLRINSNVMIMMNNSDALSGSVSEALYAENLLISAIWLPYSPYRLEKIFF